MSLDSVKVIVDGIMQNEVMSESDRIFISNLSIKIVEETVKSCQEIISESRTSSQSDIKKNISNSLNAFREKMEKKQLHKYTSYPQNTVVLTDEPFDDGSRGELRVMLSSNDVDTIEKFKYLCNVNFSKKPFMMFHMVNREDCQRFDFWNPHYQETIVEIVEDICEHMDIDMVTKISNTPSPSGIHEYKSYEFHHFEDSKHVFGDFD